MSDGAREALHELRADPRLRAIPVAALTASPDRLGGALDPGVEVNSWVQKPLTFGGLVDLTRDLHRHWLEIVELPGDT